MSDLASAEEFAMNLIWRGEKHPAKALKSALFLPVYRDTAP